MSIEKVVALVDFQASYSASIRAGQALSAANQIVALWPSRFVSSGATLEERAAALEQLRAEQRAWTAAVREDDATWPRRPRITERIRALDTFGMPNGHLIRRGQLVRSNHPAVAVFPERFDRPEELRRG